METLHDTPSLTTTNCSPANPSGYAAHGFLRTLQGSITYFGAPDAGGGAGQGTFGVIPNNPGAVAGFYFDSVGVMHGFIRYRDGNITEFDFPNSPGGTFTQAMNSAGAGAGPGWDANGLSHGFVRDPDGKFTEFDPPGLGTYARAFLTLVVVPGPSR